MRRLCLFLALSLAAIAADMRSVDVDYRDGRYFLRSDAWFDAELEALYAVFLDYDLSTQFSAAIAEARNLEPAADGRGRFYIRNEGCVMFFCRSFERYGFVEHEPYEFIQATIDPESSDFLLSDERWEFAREGDGTLVTYSLEFEPKFWVPPVIGPYVILHKLRDRGGEALDRIEVIARERGQ